MCWTRRVHISQSTLECLHGEFQVEPGHGGERCDYLRERDIQTYLVVLPKGPLGKNGINDVVSPNTSQLLSQGASLGWLRPEDLLCLLRLMLEALCHQLQRKLTALHKDHRPQRQCEPSWSSRGTRGA